MQDSSHSHPAPQAQLQAPPALSAEPALLPEPRTLPYTAVMAWLKIGGELFINQFFRWIGIYLLIVLLTIVGSFVSGALTTGLLAMSNIPLPLALEPLFNGQLIPLMTLLVWVFGLLGTALYTWFSAGLFIGADQVARGHKLQVGHLFAGFGQRFIPLTQLAVITFVFTYAFNWLLKLPDTSLVLSNVMSPDELMQNSPTRMINKFLTGSIELQTVIELLSALFLQLIFWFSIPLVALTDLPVWQALKQSLKGSVRNALTLTGYLVAAFVVTSLGGMALGIGLLIVLPWLTCSEYSAYRQVYTT